MFLSTYNNTFIDVITFDRSGNMGIGTTSPSSKLQVVGSLSATSISTASLITTNTTFGTIRATSTVDMLGGAVRVANSSSTSSFIINLGSIGVGSFRAGYLYGDGTNIELNNQNNGSLSLSTNNSERFRIKSSGDVDIYGAMRIGKNQSTSEYIINLGTSGVGGTRSGYINGDGTNLDLCNQQNGDLIMSTNNSERGRIKSNGEIGRFKSGNKY